MRKQLFQMVLCIHFLECFHLILSPKEKLLLELLLLLFVSVSKPDNLVDMVQVVLCEREL